MEATMSNKIDESFLTNFAKNMAVYITAKAVASNSDKIKKSLGIDDTDASAKKAQDKLAKQLKAKIEKLPPEQRERVLKYNKQIQQAIKIK